ncbi:MerR family transcriptional regulator [Caproicibacter fermentans]|uniref:MerR family transcriptional regulator n=1 Tax=Caproicibacter fermentans TaxID=2576756 RepID=A0A7G8T8P2_9FIRM|nr:MerR family transcriptional regulator [Caproicibacter fermentans]QNK39983.1 MerR family transcriptional regulator [Caproicibacter fermentans]
MKINEVAKLTGVTIRALHYYDAVGLLKPNGITDTGYRIYDEETLETLQQILFFKELDFSLNDIKEIMTNPHYDKMEALQKHKELLIQKRNRLDGLIALIENTIKGDTSMSFKEFDMTEIETNKKKYAAEVKTRWGNTEAYKESEEKTSSYDEQQWKILNGEGANILKTFGENRHLAPDSEAAQVLVKRWQTYITTNFYNCTKEILSCLGLMYIGDKRFTQNIDKNGTGTAEFMANSIAIYCS